MTWPGSIKFKETVGFDMFIIEGDTLYASGLRHPFEDTTSNFAQTVLRMQV